MAASTAAQSNHRFTNALATNFYYSFIFLPRDKREAVEAVYAFARRGDDLADGALRTDLAAREIARHREALDFCFSNDHPLDAGDRASHESVALARAIQRFRLPRQPFEDLILGFEMDLAMDRGEAKYETFEDLQVYCHRVAGTIGLICIEIFGYRDSRAKDYALNLGTALQLVNIVRDVQSDARRGRIYVPREDLHRFRVRPAELAEGRMSDPLVGLMQFECGRVREFFERARANLAPQDRRSLVPAEIMAAIYWRLLRKIERRSYNVFGEPVRLSRPVKFWTALSVYLGGEWHR